MAEFRAYRLDLDSSGSTDKKGNLDPPGYDASSYRELVSSAAAKKKDSSMLSRKQQALFARAQAPLKSVGMMCFMAWMFGNSIQIFSIIMTMSLLAQPLSAIMSSGDMFPKEEDWPQLDTLTPRLLFCLIQSGQFIFGLYKLNAMGLLPVFPSDWISTMPVPPVREHSFAPLH